MHHVFKQITNCRNKRRQDDEVEFRMNVVDFEHSGDQQTQKNAVPDRMKIIEVEVLIIYSDLTGSHPAGDYFFKSITRKCCLQSQKISQPQRVCDRTDDHLGNKVYDRKQKDEKTGIGFAADETNRS